MNMGVSGIIGILVIVSLLAGLVAWGGYAYRNPHSASGQMLIRVSDDYFYLFYGFSSGHFRSILIDCHSSVPAEPMELATRRGPIHSGDDSYVIQHSEYPEFGTHHVIALDA